MHAGRMSRRRSYNAAVAAALWLITAGELTAQQNVTETRDARQRQDTEFARLYAEWTSEPRYGSPLVDHLPLADGVPTPKDVLGYYVGQPETLTYYADMLRYYRALEAASRRVLVETIGASDEGRELVVVWVSSEENIANLQANRDNLARIADPRGLSDEQVRELIATTKPHYHLIGGLHSGEVGPSQMLMELAYRLAVETSPVISQIRDHVYVSITPVADPDGRDRNVDWFYRGLDMRAALDAERADSAAAADSAGVAADSAGVAADSAAVAVADSAGAAAGGGGRGGRGGRGGGFGGLPYWGKYVYHDNNRDINLSQVSMRALTDWYFTAHPPIMHDLHESQTLLYTYTGGPPQNPNLDPLLFGELAFVSNWELSQMTKWGMPGVFTHAFMDAWSPGYLGSVAYNHNGMMRMYETQSGRDVDPDTTRPVVAAGGARGRGAAAAAGGDGRGGAGAGAAAGGAGRGGAGAGAAAGGAGRGGAGAGAAAGGDGRGGAAARGRGAGGARGDGAGARGAGGGGRGDGTGARGDGAGGRGGRGGDVDDEASGRGGLAPGRRGGVPTGRGGGQPREWYRGIPVPPGATQNFTRRNNTNYMQTAVLSALQLTSMFPNLFVENFYVKTRNSMEAGREEPPHGYVVPVQRDMTRVATLVNVLRAQAIEVGRLSSELALEKDTFPAGSYVVKLDQPYGRLAKNLLERQDYPDPSLRTYDDSGWTMGYALDVEVEQVDDAAILDAPVTPVDSVPFEGRVAGDGGAGVAIAHYGSNNMVMFRYELRNVPMRIAESSFTANGVEFPAGSFIVAGSAANRRAARAAATSLGLTAAALPSLPAVPTHEADVPRVAIYSQWSGTQELGWWRHAFDQFGIPFDLIYKERVMEGGLERDYDVIVMAPQNINRSNVLAEPADRPQPYEKTEKLQFLGMYGSTPDMSGGFGAAGVAAFEGFLEAGGTLIAAHSAVRFPIEFGFARTIDIESPDGVSAQKPLIEAEIVRMDHPVFYGQDDEIFPIKYGSGSQVFRVGVADRANVLAQYVGSEESVLSGLMEGAANIAERAFAVDVPGAHNGKGRVIMFANNPIYRWQNHGEFNMVFNAIINWNDVPPEPELEAVSGGGRGGG